MNTAMEILDAGLAANNVMKLVEGALVGARDLTATEAHQMVRLATQLHCTALAIERKALGIPDPKRGG